jgi:hypothetical protein
MTEIYWHTRDLKVINATCHNIGIQVHLTVNYTTIINPDCLDQHQKEYISRCKRDGLLEVRIRK